MFLRESKVLYGEINEVGRVDLITESIIHSKVLKTLCWHMILSLFARQSSKHDFQNISNTQSNVKLYIPNNIWQLYSFENIYLKKVIQRLCIFLNNHLQGWISVEFWPQNTERLTTCKENPPIWSIAISKAISNCSIRSDNFFYLFNFSFQIQFNHNWNAFEILL